MKKAATTGRARLLCITWRGFGGAVARRRGANNLATLVGSNRSGGGPRCRSSAWAARMVDVDGGFFLLFPPCVLYRRHCYCMVAVRVRVFFSGILNQWTRRRLDISTVYEAA